MSALVADTHTLVWYLTEPARLSASATRAMEETARAGDSIFISAITLVELCYLVERGRLVSEVWSRVTTAVEREAAVLVVRPLNFEIARTLASIPRNLVPDMPDRIIAATARHLDLPLVTRDDRLRHCGLHTIW